MKFLRVVNIVCCLFVGCVVNILLYGWMNQRFPDFYRYLGAGYVCLFILNILWETVIKNEIYHIINDNNDEER